MARSPIGSLSSMQQLAQVTAQLKSDWADIAKSAQQFNGAVAGAGGVTQQAQASVNPAGTQSTSTTAQQTGATGYANGTGMRLGPIARAYVTGGMRGAAPVAAAIGAMKVIGFAGNVGLSMVNDFRPGREQALDYELSRQVARMGTGDYTRFQDNLMSAMNGINVQNRQVFERDVAVTLNQGYAQMMAGDSMAGKEKSAAQLVGSMHSLAAMAGMPAESVASAQSSMYSAKAFYSSLASGVMTRNPTTGDMLSPEQIINQYRRSIPGLAGASQEELARALAPGSGLRLMLEQQMGPEGAEIIMTGLRATTEAGRGFKPGETVDQLAKEVGMAGTEYTQGRESESRRQKSEEGVIAEYANKVTEGIKTANDMLTSINEHIARASGNLRDLYDFFAKSGGMMDTFGAGAPSTTNTVVNGVGGLFNGMSNLATGAMTAGMISKAMGGAGIPGLPNVLGGSGTGLRAAGLTGALKMLGKGALKGSGILSGVLGVVESGSAITSALKGDLKDRGENIDHGDFWQRMLWRGVQGAAAGTVVAPGVGTLIGGIGGLVVGGLEGWAREANDYDQGYSEGSWFVEKDQKANIHQGEMILPNRVAEAVRTELRHGTGKSSLSTGGSGNRTSVVINLTLQRATDQEAMIFAQQVRRYMQDDDELVRAGSGSLSNIGVS